MPRSWTWMNYLFLVSEMPNSDHLGEDRNYTPISYKTAKDLKQAFAQYRSTGRLCCLSLILSLGLFLFPLIV